MKIKSNLPILNRKINRIICNGVCNNDKQLNSIINDNKGKQDFETLRQRILSFQVVNKTPMQAFGFINGTVTNLSETNIGLMLSNQFFRMKLLARFINE